jgi:hypothetical protein
VSSPVSRCVLWLSEAKVLQTTQLRPRISEVDVVEVELEVSVRKEVEATELCWLDDEE